MQEKTETITLEDLRELEARESFVSEGEPEDWDSLADDVPEELIKSWRAKIEASARLDTQITKHLGEQAVCKPSRIKKAFTMLTGLALLALTIYAEEKEKEKEDEQ